MGTASMYDNRDIVVFICPFSFSVCGWDILVMEANDIFGVSSSSSEWQSC